jgi:hypothetical protein
VKTLALFGKGELASQFQRFSRQWAANIHSVMLAKQSIQVPQGSHGIILSETAQKIRKILTADRGV